MRIKLTQAEEAKLIMAINNESHYREMLRASSEHRKNIFDLITSNHEVDLNTVDQRSGTIENGFLILTELPKKPE